eukprot:PhM_4_TR5744/c0_g1_i1/m.103614
MSEFPTSVQPSENRETSPSPEPAVTPTSVPTFSSPGSAALSPGTTFETKVPLVQPMHGPRRYKDGSITVTHTSANASSYEKLRQCSEETLQVRSKTATRVEKVTFSPYALYKYGNTYHYRSMGYSHKGDIVLQKEEVSGSSDVENARRARSVSPPPGQTSYFNNNSSVVSNGSMPRIENEAVNLENGRKYPGVRVVRGRKARERARNSYLLQKAVGDNMQYEEGLAQPIDDEMRTRPSLFHNDDGEIDSVWKKLIHVTEEQQAELIGPDQRQRPVPTVDLSSCTSRFESLAKEHKALLRTCVGNTVLMEVLEGIESSVAEWCAAWTPSSEPMHVILEDACHRKLLHSVAGFYALKSCSETVDGNRRATRVSPLVADKKPIPPPEMLSTFLKRSGVVQCADDVQYRPRHRGRGRKPRGGH